jgi:addiction module HigA family antidote
MATRTKRSKKAIPPIHPGEMLREDFLEPLGMSVNQLALALRVPATRLYEIANGRRSITADTAMRLGRYFGQSVRFWLGLQMQYELERAEEELAEKIHAEVQPRRAA